MALKLALAAILAAVIPLGAGVAVNQGAVEEPAVQLTQRTCTDPSESIPLLRAFKAKSPDHFYTANAGEMAAAVAGGGYVQEGSPGNIFPTQGPGTIPLFRLNNGHHFYTTSSSELNTAVNTLGFVFENVAGFVYNDSSCSGTIPLSRLVKAQGDDHFYTTDATERDSAVASLGFVFEGIQTFIVPA